MRLEPTRPEVPRRRDIARPEFRQLAIFLTVVETRSFAAAGRLLRVSQPAISQAIRRLENIYGGDIFERRRGAALGLTPIGEAILPSARILLDVVDRQMVRAASTAQSRAGSLTVGFFTGLATGPLRAAITDFAAQSPQVRLRLAEASPSELHEKLCNRTLDVMIVALMPQLQDARFEEELLWDERLFAALHASHPLAVRETLTWDDLASAPLILRHWQNEMRSYRALISRVGEREVDCELHAVSREALLDMVEMGLGTTILSETTLPARTNVVFRLIAEDNAHLAVKAVWRRDDANPLRHRFLTHLRTRRDAFIPSPIVNADLAMRPAPDHG